ncbi:MAG: gamma-glutamyl-gamma-aminobutyrate hydrolase family protein [Paenisporosarcina sp.]
MKPIIGVSTNLKNQVLSVSTDYLQAITAFGGVPIVLPNLREDDINSVALLLDGLLLTGGGDIDPTLFDEEPIPNLGNITPERDSFEIGLIQKLLHLNKPILGICRGCQILNIAVGGNMYQDIYSQVEKPLLQHNQAAPRHHASHFIQIIKETKLHGMLQSNLAKVNSFHHQAVKKIPKPFEVCAVANDGMIEAIESTEHAFALGIQWHPEGLLSKNDVVSTLIFSAFINACLKI